MTSMQLRSAVEGLKRKESKDTVRPDAKSTSVRHPVSERSAFADGVEMARDAVKQYRKALQKIK